MKNRIELAKYFNELGFKSGAEIGACYGRYSEILCKAIPGLKLIAIDNWNNHENTRRLKTTGVPGEEVTRKLLAPFDATIIKASSMDAVKNIPDESLDFVFIDANHSYDCVKEDIREWSKKVRKGGIVSGHDYYVFPGSGNRGVVDAVDEYTKENNIELLTTDWDKENEVRDDRQPCWYYIK
jgi:predicted O-methyltransferase YrrM